MDTLPARPESPLSMRLRPDILDLENRLTGLQVESRTSAALQFPIDAVSNYSVETSSPQSAAMSVSTLDSIMQLEPMVSTDTSSKNVDGHQTLLSFDRPNENNEGSISSTVEKTDISTLAQGNVSQLFINSPTFQGTLAELVLDLDKLKTLCNDLYKQLGAALEENQKLQKEMSNLKKENTAAMEKSERIISEALASNRKAMQSKATTEKQLDIVTSLKDEYCSKAKFLEAQVVEAESERDLTINIMNSELKGMSAKLQVSRVQHVASLEGVKATLRQTQWRLQLADQRLKNELELREGTMRTADADGVEMEDAEDMENEGDEELVNGVNHEP